MSARPLPMPINLALLQHAEERRKRLENRIADQITRFAGSIQFVYLHPWGMAVVAGWDAALTFLVSIWPIILRADTARSPTSQDGT